MLADQVKQGRQIVIDASVARGAGETTHPDSVICRQTLQAMQAEKHRLVMCQAMRLEWQKHASYRAKRFLTTMTSQGRVTNVDKNETYYESILAQVTSQTTKREGVEKDLHLTGAALATDKRVISFDKKMRRFMVTACIGVEILREMMWLHPLDHDAPQWLRDGALSVPKFYLGYQADV